MLTKDLLKYRIRSGRVKPVFVDASEERWLKQARSLVQVFDGAEGRRFADLEQELSEEFGEDTISAGLKKLLFDRCTQAEDDGALRVQRWQRLKFAHHLRKDMQRPDLESFHLALSDQFDAPFTEIAAELYADLPSERPIQGFRTLQPEQLIHRYNNAQVQGLLLRAQEVEVTLRDIGLVDRRAILRSLKFHRLMPRVVEQQKDRLSFCLEGPLTMFQHGQSYGLRLANFFPLLPQLPRWQLKAEVQVKNKRVTLNLSEKDGMKSHYRAMTGYVPPELTICCEEFNQDKKNRGWQVRPGDDLVNLGHGELCFPDLSFSRNGESLNLELFHKWHRSTVIKRVTHADATVVENFAIGVDRALLKDEKIAACLKEHAWANSNSLIFNQFPTAKVLLSFIAHHD